MPLDIDPTVDYVFKRLFGDPANKDLLIHLLNAVLQLASPITHVEILNPFNAKEFGDDKLSVVDVKAQCSDGRWYNVEMQRDVNVSLRNRLAYYCAVQFVDQMTEGDDYQDLTPAITICFLSEPLFAGSAEPHLRFILCDNRHQVALTDHLQVHTIELTKYNFLREELASSDDLTRWSFFLREAAELESAELRQLLPQPAFQKATGVVEMIAQTPEERRQYEARRKAERDHNWRMRYALEAGREAGREEGREEGLAEGHKQNQSQTIQKLQRILNLPATPETELLAMEFADLNLLCNELIGRLKPSAS